MNTQDQSQPHPSGNVDDTSPEVAGQSQAATPSGKPVGHSGARVEIDERPAGGVSGLPAFALLLLDITAFVVSCVSVVKLGMKLDTFSDAGQSAPGWVGFSMAAAIVIMVVAIFLLVSSFVILQPGMTSVRSFFGRYVGTVRTPGLNAVMPLTSSKRTSVRVRNFETNTIKVNDLDGNPINIAAIVVWQVSDTARACFAVEQYQEFVSTQSEAALRHVAGSHPYDGGSPDLPSLLGATDVVSKELAHEVAERVALAGVEVVEVRISALAYAPEIAQAMLQRQQAGAVIAAREQIVEGAVTMVNDALERLERENIVELDEERRAQMVSNLLVVLCSESRTSPVINAGSLYG